MKTKLLILLLFIARIAFGQAWTTEDNKFSLEICPTAFLDFENGPMYEIGTEYKLHKNISMYIQGGGYIPAEFDRISDIKGYLIKAEIKYYLNADEVSTGKYVALTGTYKNQSFNFQDSIRLNPPYLKTFRDFKSIYAFSIKYGNLHVFNSGIIIDWYIGIGLRFKYVTSTLTPQEVATLRYNNDSSYDSDILGDTTFPYGYALEPNADIGIRIGYRIK
jgi:hypothetical protein